jgi:hypothetical protein
MEEGSHAGVRFPLAELGVPDFPGVPFHTEPSGRIDGVLVQAVEPV